MDESRLPGNLNNTTVTLLTTGTDIKLDDEDEIEPTFKQCLKSKMFWIIYIMASLSVCKSFIN